MFNYVEIDVGFERTPFFPTVVDNEPPNFAHVCLAKPDPAFQAEQDDITVSIGTFFIFGNFPICLKQDFLIL
jgi:hypothetical protein